MSVASMAGYLANSGGGGGQSSYYKAYSIDTPSAYTPSDDELKLFEIQVPPTGTYLITTFLTIQSSTQDGESGEYDPIGVVETADVIVVYSSNISPYIFINGQTYLSGSTTPQCNIQTSGVFVSDGTGTLIISVKVAVSGGATVYNVLLLPDEHSSPQVQIAGLTGSGGGGTVNDINEGLGIVIKDEGGGNYLIENSGIIGLDKGDGISIDVDNDTGIGTITNAGVTSIIAGDGININNNGIGAVTITSTVNPTDYYTSTQADGLFQTLTGMGVYSTTSQANGLYQTLIDMASYSTTAIANGLYQSLTDMANYSTTAQANGLYVAKSNFLYRQFDIVFPQILNTGDSLNGQLTITNFVGTLSTTGYFMTPTNIPSGPPPTNGNFSNFTTTIGYSSNDGTNTVLTYYIRNNGDATVENLQAFFDVFIYKT